MAPDNNKNRQPEILGAVSKGSIRFNSQATKLPEKRGQSPVTDQGLVTKKSKVSQGGQNLGFGTPSVASTTEHSRGKQLPSGSLSTYHRLPSGSFEDQNARGTQLPSGSLSTYHRLPSGSFEDNNARSGGSSLLHAASATSGDVGSSAPKVSPDATHAISSEGEFSDLDMEDLDEVDLQQLESQVLGQTSVVGEDDGPLTRENEAGEFLDSDLDDLSEADLEKLLGSALLQAPTVEKAAGEDDGAKTCENLAECFLDSDLDDLSETDLERLVGPDLLQAPTVEDEVKGSLSSNLDRHIHSLACQDVTESAEAVVGGDSITPVVNVDELEVSAESIDIDAQILDKDRIDVHVSNVEDDGMECSIDEECIPKDVRENEPLTVTEGTAVAVRAEQAVYDRAWIVCDRLCQSARAEREWDSGNSPLSIDSWNWFRKTEPGELAGIVYKRMLPEARRALSKPRPDVLDLLELPEPKRDDLADSCNNAGVYVFVCHAERKVDPRSGDLEAVDNDSVGCYTGQSIAMPQKDGREGMSLRFDQHRRELMQTIPELEEKAKKASANVPRFYRIVVENKLEAHPRVVATLPRDGHLAAHAMLIETVIMVMTGSVSEESSYGLPTKDIVADIQEQLSYEGRMKHQPMTLNRALPVHQGFRSSVRVFQKCSLCEHDSSNYKLGLFTSPLTQQCVCRGCLLEKQPVS